MYPSRFRYEAPRTIGEAIDLLSGVTARRKCWRVGRACCP